MNDPLEILQSIVDEVKALRITIETNKVFMQNITIRLALWQLDHGAIDDYANNDARWDKLLSLAEAGTLRVAHDCTVILDNSVLSPEVLRDA